MKHLILLWVLGSFLFAFPGLNFSSKKLKNGEALLVEYKAAHEIRPLFVSLENKQFKFYKLDRNVENYYALIPFHYDTKLGLKKIIFHYEEEGRLKKEKAEMIDVIWGRYPKETLRVDPSKIKLSKKDEKRVEKEYYQAIKIYNKHSQDFLPKERLQTPLKSVITSKFGNERLFNGFRKSYHSGVDYRAEIGTDIYAIGKGKVVLVQDRFYAGLSVIVDHGQGIYSCYYHLSESLVHIGDTVNNNSVLGLSGASGRITGPHLHFSMKVHGVTVNPLTVLKQLNYLIQKKESIPHLD